MKPILCYGDMHHGSLLGMWPPGVKKEYGGTSGRNKYQRALWRVWKHLIEERCPQRWPDGFPVAVSGGDVIDGKQPRQGGVCTEVTNIRIQSEAAVISQEPLRDMIGDWYFLEGTPYHEENDYLSGEFIARELGGMKSEYGHHIFPELPLTVNGINFHFKHELSYFLVHRGTALERELKWALSKEAMEMMGENDVLVRFHVHTHTMVSFTVGSKLKAALTIPALSIESKFATKKTRFRPIAHIGALVIEVYGPDHDPPFVVVPLTYPTQIRRLKRYHA